MYLYLSIDWCFNRYKVRNKKIQVVNGGDVKVGKKNNEC
jgi:hypothetical protein